jgi:hypothetical protein
VKTNRRIDIKQHEVMNRAREQRQRGGAQMPSASNRPNLYIRDGRQVREQPNGNMSAVGAPKKGVSVKLALLVFAAALAGAGLTGGAFRLADHAHQQQCIQNLNANLQEQGNWPLDQSQVERVCRADGDFAVVEVKARY